MCLIIFSFQPDTDKPLIIAANRDEFLSRPSRAAHFWDDTPEVLAGRDLVGQGTWLGITKTGRFAAVTNVREPGVVVADPLSRGELTRGFLTGSENAKTFMEGIQEKQQRYNGFNLLLGEISSEKQELFYLSNRSPTIEALTAGTYGLSNHLLNTPWPKVEAGKRWMDEELNISQTPDELNTKLRKFLENPTTAADKKLPETGVSYDKEKALSAAFITMEGYGTRTSTIVQFHQKDQLEVFFSEKNYGGDNKGSFISHQLLL